jgi:hypothetical protein
MSLGRLAGAFLLLMELAIAEAVSRVGINKSAINHQQFLCG